MGMSLPAGKERQALANAGRLVCSVIVAAPPSTNELFNAIVINGRVRWVKDKAYTAWIAAAGPVARTLTSPTGYPVEITYTAIGKWNKQRDLGNIEKSLTDLLVAEGVIGGDHLGYVGGIVLRYAPSEGPPRVRVSLSAPPSLFGR